MSCHMSYVSSAWFLFDQTPKKQAPVSLHWPQSSLPRSRKKTTSTNLHQQRPIGFLEFISPVDSLEYWKRILSEFWGFDDLMSFQVGKNSWGGHVFWVKGKGCPDIGDLSIIDDIVRFCCSWEWCNQTNMAVNFPTCRLINQQPCVWSGPTEHQKRHGSRKAISRKHKEYGGGPFGMGVP